MIYRRDCEPLWITRPEWPAARKISPPQPPRTPDPRPCPRGGEVMFQLPAQPALGRVPARRLQAERQIERHGLAARDHRLEVRGLDSDPRCYFGNAGLRPPNESEDGVAGVCRVAAQPLGAGLEHPGRHGAVDAVKFGRRLGLVPAGRALAVGWCRGGRSHDGAHLSGCFYPWRHW